MLTQALHGVHAEDLAGPLGPEVVTGYVLTVTATEHQPVAVLFLPRFQVLQVRTPCLCTSCTLCPDPRRFCGLCRPEQRAALNLTAHVVVPSTPDPNSCGGIQAAQGSKEAGRLQSTHAPPHPHRGTGSTLFLLQCSKPGPSGARKILHPPHPGHRLI